jgi:hypothetical protein
MKKKKIFTIPDEEIENLFSKFSHPIVKSALTESQKSKSLQIAKTLWLLLVSHSDSEKNIYEVLNQMSLNHKTNVSIGSLYFYRMKKALSNTEKTKLYNHYRSPDNFNKLQGWGELPFDSTQFH